MKINHVKDQSVKSSNCGYFAMKFLKDRKDKSWKDVTKYTILEKV